MAAAAAPAAAARAPRPAAGVTRGADRRVAAAAARGAGVLPERAVAALDEASHALLADRVELVADLLHEVHALIPALLVPALDLVHVDAPLAQGRRQAH